MACCPCCPDPTCPPCFACVAIARTWQFTLPSLTNKTPCTECPNVGGKTYTLNYSDSVLSGICGQCTWIAGVGRICQAGDSGNVLWIMGATKCGGTSCDPPQSGYWLILTNSGGCNGNPCFSDGGDTYITYFSTTFNCMADNVFTLFPAINPLQGDNGCGFATTSCAGWPATITVSPVV